ncbi:hypothetical protein F5Y10DRAFT_233341 [Nemania abortiva]|nr:hypothetical protein F5Y10DRAFT_233341 [Nemania abortiva]
MVNGHKRIVRLLAKKGANLESKDNSGWTPLLWAANEGHQDIVQLLVGSGACFDVKDSCGWTPLWLAALRKHRKIIQLLVDKGADVNSKDISGRTPLSWARHNEHKEIEQLMIKKGARIKPEDSQGSKTYIYGANDISLQLDKPTQGRKAMRFTPYHDLGYTAPGRNSSKTIQTTVYDLNTVLDEPSQPTKALSDDATMADSRTQSFFAPGAKEPPDRDLLNGLAKVLLRNADLKGLSGQARDRVSGISPQLLESFSERLASGSPSKIYYDVAVFICKYRHEISTYFMQHINQNPTEAPPSSTLKDHTTIKAEYGSRKWQGDVAEAVDHETIDLYNHDEERGLMEETDRLVDEGLEDEIIQTLRRCKEIVHGSLAHSWLLLNLKKEVSLMQAEPNIMDAIRTSILSPLPPTRIFDGVNFLRNFGVRFNVEWDPLKFFTSQFKGQARDMLELTLTLTGSFENAQAATCMSYIQQTWPSSGEYTVKLLSEVLMEPSVWNECNLPDDTALSAQICESKLVVIVLGTRDAIAEIGEQLAWISAALRLAPDDQGIYGSRSSIRQIEIGKVPADLPKAPQSLDACFDILCGTPAPPTERHSTGQCWHDLFKNPTIVHGYPIPRRARENTGLEIPLHILADLVQTAQISTFGEKIFLKGFSSMLVLMDQIEDSTLWHLDLNRDGSYISYADASKSAATKSLVVGNIMKNIMRSRHIVGWCLKAKFYTGTDKAPYPVKKPALDAPNDKCILYQTRPSWVKVIEKQPSYYRTHREEPAHMHYGGDLHHRRLERLKDKYVNLWDVESERGWLVNGVSALLHLLRARLEHVSEDDSHGPKLKELSMPDRYTVGSSIKFFKNLENMNLAVYPNGYEGEGRPFTIMDQSGRLYNALDNLIESQAVALRQQISASRKYLSGWAFRDLATEKEQLEPYAITLPEIGRSWVDFTRAISTVTLFGRDFGELIRPGKACEAWAELPRGRSFLATSGQVLRRIMDDVGNSPGKPWRLGRDIVWHNPTRSCKCSRTTQSNHAVNIQVLLPEEVSREVPQEINTKEPEDDSAFIFGFNFESSWLWGEFGYPTKTTVSSLPENFKYPTPGDSGGGSESGISDGLPTSTKVYTVGILCTLPEEGAAMKTLFDIVDGEPDNYVLGSIGDHNVALAYLPLESGIAAASAAASRLVTDFPSIRFGFLVGIAGGVPSSKADIRLGDVVVGVPQDTHPGVIQLGRGKDLEHNGFQRTGSLNRPPQFLLAAIASMIADSQQYRIQLNKLIERIVETKPRYRYPGQQFDVLYSASCHECTEECSDKDSHLPDRRPRDLAYPVVHRGLIGSSDRVLKDSKKRDQLAKNYGILCVEMEAAGVMRSDIPFLVIRGISDYADSHKNDQWHSYASLTAAAFAKMLLCKVTGPGGPIKHNQRNLKRSFSHHNSPPRSARRRLDEDASYSLDAKS